MRRKARECAFKIIYQMLFFPIEKEEIAKLFCEENLSEEDFNFANEIIKVYKENEEALHDEVANSIKGYDFNRIYKIDLALVYTALCEIQFLNSPKAIVVNEIIEISKVYSTEKSPKFINGLLSAIFGSDNV